MPFKPQTLPCADAHAAASLDAHMAHPGGAGRGQIQGRGDRALGQFDLQGQGALHGGLGWGAATAAAREAQGHQQQQGKHRQPLQGPPGLPGSGAWQGGQHGGSETATMIGWLQGQVQDPWQQANRFGVVLVVAGVGYEVQLSRRQFAELPPQGARLTLHVHHIIRDDGWSLYGFAERCERDLFRELVAVSGVGPQVGLALLGELAPRALVAAIIQADLRCLAQAPGVGKRTAERLSVELRSRLQQRFSDLVDAFDGEADDADAGLEHEPALSGSGREEVRLTLAALGYEALEIQRAMRAVAARGQGPDGEGLPDDPDGWIRACLRWLSRDAA